MPRKIDDAYILPYSGLFSWVEIYVKCWMRSSELIFVVLIFVHGTHVIVEDDEISTCTCGRGFLAEVRTVTTTMRFTI